MVEILKQRPPLPLTREHLDQTGCGTPNCQHDHTVLYLHARCHPREGTVSSYDKRTGTITVKCKRCKALVVEVLIAEKSPANILQFIRPTK